MEWGLDRATVVLDGFVALRGLTFRVGAGAIGALVGPDGSGKTTALRALVGAVSLDDGTVDAPGPQRIGYMSAGPGVYPDLTVQENLAFCGTAYALHAREIEERGRALLARAGLDGARDRLARNLSGGMRQKLALICALIHEPALLVLDEPTTGVDPVSRAELWRLMARAASRGAAVILSTSYVEEAERATRVAVLANGEARLAGAPDDLVRAIGGSLFEVAGDPGSRWTSWPRGPRRRLWSPVDEPPPGARRVNGDLEDAVVVADFERERAGLHEKVPA